MASDGTITGFAEGLVLMSKSPPRQTLRFCLFETESCCVTPTGLELAVFLPQPLGCWDYRCHCHARLDTRLVHLLFHPCGWWAAGGWLGEGQGTSGYSHLWWKNPSSGACGSGRRLRALRSNYPHSVGCHQWAQGDIWEMVDMSVVLIMMTTASWATSVPS